MLQDLNAVISTWALILGLFGGIAVTLFVYNIEKGDVIRSNLQTAGIIVLIIAPILAVWLVRDIFRNETSFYIFIGILFGVIISVILHLLIVSYTGLNDLTRDERRDWRNKTVFMTGICAIDLLAMAVWLGWFIHLAL